MSAADGGIRGARRDPRVRSRLRRRSPRRRDVEAARRLLRVAELEALEFGPLEGPILAEQMPASRRIDQALIALDEALAGRRS